jgi:signal transduction histidine kinase/FixJ family two-component response regulator
VNETRVLIVEDNRADARLLGELFAEVPDGPFVLSTVQTLGDALPLVPAHDVVLLDLSLPDAQGVATLEQMVGAGRATPVVVLTGNDDERIAMEAVKAGAQDYLLKHEITPQLLVRSIRYAIERKRVEHSEVERAKSDLAAHRAQFVAAVMAEVTRSLDLKTALTGTAHVLVPQLADLAIIDLVQDDGRLAAIAQAGYEGELPMIEPASSGSVHDPVLLAVQQRSSVWTAELDIDTADDRHRALLEGAGAQAIFVTPLTARGNLIGAISYVLCTPRTFDGEARRLAEEVASSAALAIDNMRLFEQAQRAVRGRDELLAIVSHDLRNPINVIALAVATLERPEPAMIVPTLARVRRALKRMEHLIDDLLDVARVDAGTLQVDLSARELAPVLDEVHEQWRPLCAEKNVALVKEYSPERIGVVQLDRDRLVQVLANLIGNAIKFTPAGGSVRLGADLLGPWVRVSVSDTGPGISPENLPHVFDRFWQKERRTDGLGLGLAIARGIVEAHGGTLQVESTLDVGTRFSFTLRRATT